MSADLKKKLEEQGRIENRLRREERKLANLRRAMKEQLLAGASIESGDVYAELRLLPGRDPSSTNPDDYDLILSYVFLSAGHHNYSTAMWVFVFLTPASLWTLSITSLLSSWDSLTSITVNMSCEPQHASAILTPTRLAISAEPARAPLPGSAVMTT